MVRLMNDLMTHASKMHGTDWAATSDLGCLEQLVRVWLRECFPQCVREPATLQAFSTLIAAMPSREAVEVSSQAKEQKIGCFVCFDALFEKNDMVELSQAKSQLLKRGAATGPKKNTLLKRTQRIFVASPRPLPADFLQIDVLDVPAAEFALEVRMRFLRYLLLCEIDVLFLEQLTRITLALFRDIPIEKLVQRDLGIDQQQVAFLFCRVGYLLSDGAGADCQVFFRASAAVCAAGSHRAAEQLDSQCGGGREAAEAPRSSV
jgi:hypothetical protein